MDEEPLDYQPYRIVREEVYSSSGTSETNSSQPDVVGVSGLDDPFTNCDLTTDKVFCHLHEFLRQKMYLELDTFKNSVDSILDETKSSFQELLNITMRTPLSQCCTGGCSLEGGKTYFHFMQINLD
ncbi:uncharacterized protein LOC141915328 [Tubulanus polymorphus]|uniref:uncharacterized protein LOC141915328 n=1 Tax=Tubulanus polymorphus TaxID=672921 RepID=UPI003DA6A500